MISLTLLVGGCSIVLDPGSLRGGGGFDADTDPDARVAEDAGPDARTADDAGDAGETDPDGGGCVAGEMMCGGGCVDTRTSNAHCGACDNACDAEQSCVAGECRPSVEIGVSFGGSGWDSARGVASDSLGNVYVVGEFRDTVDFGGGDLTSDGGIDAYVVSFTAAGAYRWARRFGGPAEDKLQSVAFSDTAGVIVAGYFSNTVDFGTGAVVSAGGTDGFVAALDPDDGATRWVDGFGGADADHASGVAVDGDEIYVAGDHRGPFTFDGSVGHDGEGDGVVLAYRSTGTAATRRWAFELGGAGFDAVDAVAVSPDGTRVCAAGWFSASVTLGGTGVASAGDVDGILLCLTASGSYDWHTTLGSAGYDALAGVSFGSDFVAVTGIFSADTSFGSTPLSSVGGWDAVVAAVSVSGAPLWASSIPSPGDFDYALDVQVGPTDRVTMVAIMQGEVSLPGAPLAHAGGQDGFIGTWSRDGSLAWARLYGSSLDDALIGLAYSPGGELWAVGEFHLTVDFGLGPFTAAGDYDAVVLRYAP
ncbi:MAG: hypothetical protein VYE22_04445 [Myxococcota bacterium]|nr:hypothetical protein [Myxococcota bacterium]